MLFPNLRVAPLVAPDLNKKTTFHIYMCMYIGICEYTRVYICIYT